MGLRQGRSCILGREEGPTSSSFLGLNRSIACDLSGLEVTVDRS